MAIGGLDGDEVVWVGQWWPTTSSEDLLTAGRTGRIDGGPESLEPAALTSRWRAYGTFCYGMS